MNLFLKLTDDDHAPFYVRVNDISAVGAPEAEMVAAGAGACLIINGNDLCCRESVESVLDALYPSIDIIEVEQAA